MISTYLSTVAAIHVLRILFVAHVRWRKIEMLTSTQQNGNLKNMGIFPLNKKLNSQVWVPHSGVEQQKNTVPSWFLTALWIDNGLMFFMHWERRK